MDGLKYAVIFQMKSAIFIKELITKYSVSINNALFNILLHDNIFNYN